MRWIIAILVAGTLALGGVSAWKHMEAKAFVSDLQLAYDASTPKAKAQYLQQFITQAEAANLPEYGSWVVQRANLKTANQLDILRSLVERCTELAALDRASMGFSQGMTQLTGDEFEYIKSNAIPFFEKARRIESGWLLINGFFIGVGLTGGAIFCKAAGWSNR